LLGIQQPLTSLDLKCHDRDQFLEDEPEEVEENVGSMECVTDAGQFNKYWNSFDGCEFLHPGGMWVIILHDLI